MTAASPASEKGIANAYPRNGPGVQTRTVPGAKRTASGREHVCSPSPRNAKVSPRTHNVSQVGRRPSARPQRTESVAKHAVAGGPPSAERTEGCHAVEAEEWPESPSPENAVRQAMLAGQTTSRTVEVKVIRPATGGHYN